MNTLSLKHKSLFYSLLIHSSLVALVFFAMYTTKEEKHEVYSLVNLQSMYICAPSAAKPLKKRQEIVQRPRSEKPVVNPVVKKIKPLEKKLVKKVLPKQRPMSRKVLVKKEEPVKKQEELTKTFEPSQVATKTAVAEEKTAPVVTVSEKKLSYEAQYMQDNIALINALIKKNLFYPRLAKKRGMQGKAMVSFTLNVDGEVIGIKALGDLSSILKKSAIKTVRKASFSFPHPHQVLALRIPIVYKLH